MKTPEQKMLEEIALRNAISLFRKKNAASKNRTASIPKVGVFWIDQKGSMFAEGVSLREAEDYGEFRIFDKSHLNVWNTAVAKNKQWSGLEYEEVPRGRVVYKQAPKSPHFIVYLPKQLAKYKSKLLEWFNIPTGYALFDFSDEHYRVGEVYEQP